VFRGDLRQGLPGTTVCNNLRSVDIHGTAANPAPFQFRTTHPSPNMLDDEAALQFGNRSDYDHHRSPEWSAGVDVLSEADELNPEVIQFIEHFQEMPHASGHPVECGHEHDIEAVPPGIGHKLVEAGALGFRAANHIAIFMHDFILALFGHFAQVVQLRLGMLVPRLKPECKRQPVSRVYPAFLFPIWVVNSRVLLWRQPWLKTSLGCGQGLRGVTSTVASRLLQFLGSLLKVLINRTPDEFCHRSACLVG
jgi:hypothetical protein